MMDIPSASSVMRPRKSDALRQEHRRADLAGPKRGQPVREPRHGGRDMALRRRKAGQAVGALEAVELVARKLAAPNGERADELVVAARDVARSGRLRDLGVVQLGRVAVDVEDPSSEALQRLDDEILEHCLLGRAGADTVAPDGVEPELRRTVARPARRGRQSRRARPRGPATRGAALPRTSSPAWPATRPPRRPPCG